MRIGIANRERLIAGRAERSAGRRRTAKVESRIVNLDSRHARRVGPMVFEPETETGAGRARRLDHFRVGIERTPERRVGGSVKSDLRDFPSGGEMHHAGISGNDQIHFTDKRDGSGP